MKNLKLWALIAIATMFSSVALGLPVIYQNGNEAKITVDNVNINDHFGFYYGTTSPVANCIAAGAGSVFHQSNGDTFTKLDNGLTCNWTKNATASQLSTVAFSGDYNDLINAPGPGATAWGAIGGDINDQADLIAALGLKANSSSLATVATSGQYADLSGKPTLATVATSGAYADLSGTPNLSLKEDTANKSTDVVTDQASNTKYPSVKAVYDWVVANFQAALGFTPENVDNKDNGALSTSSTTYPTSGAARTYALTMVGGLPTGVYLTQGNKIDFRLHKDGLLIQSYNLPAQTAGAYNGGGTGNKAIVGFDNYNNVLLSSLTNLSFTARSVRDENGATLLGNVYWNILANFNTGATSLATDYVNLAIEGLSQHLPVPIKYFKLTNSHAAYTIDATILANERMVKAVGGTEGVSNLVTSAGATAASMVGTYTSGSPIVTGLDNTASLTVGQYIADAGNGEYANSSKVPAGAQILSIDSPTQITMSMNAQGTSGTMATMFYGGVAPVSRAVTCNGTTTISGVSNTDDLQANMLVSGSGVPANSYIVSKVRNTSITLNNSCASGSPTISFVPAGKTGIPGNGTNIGITWAKMVANNPNGYFANTAPTVAGGWLAADGGWPKNSVQSAINFVQGGSSTLDARINSLKSVTINSDTYLFTNQ